MNKVYVVMYHDYEDHHIINIFDNKEKAELCKNEKQRAEDVDAKTRFKCEPPLIDIEVWIVE